MCTLPWPHHHWEEMSQILVSILSLSQVLDCLYSIASLKMYPIGLKRLKLEESLYLFFFFFFSPENCFSLISYCVFSDPTNELMSCYCRSLGIKVNKQIWLQSMSKEGCAFFTLDKESKIQSKLYWLSAQAWSPFSLSWDNFVRSEPKFCPFLMLSIHPKRNTGCMHAEYSMYKVSSFLLNKLLNFLLFS